MMIKGYVIYIGEMIMPDKNAAAQRAIAVAKSIKDIGYTPVILGLSHTPPSNNIIDTKIKHFGIDCFCVKYPKTTIEWLNRILTIKPILEVIEHYGEKNIKAIIALDYEAIPLYKLNKLCNRKSIRLIADTVEWYEKSNLHFPKNLAKDIDTWLRMRVIYPRLKYMICISKYLYNEFKDTCNRIAIVPGTVDPTDHKWTDICHYSKLETPTIGYAGYPGPNFAKERLDLLIKAIYDLNKEGINCKLKIAGVKLETLKKYLPELFIDEYIENIDFLGELSHIECLNMIARCDFSAIIREDRLVTRAGFPTKLSESLACGTPVIVTPSSNVIDYVEHKKNGFISPDFSYSSIKDTMKTAIVWATENDMLKVHEYTRANNPLIYSNFTANLHSLFE